MSESKRAAEKKFIEQSLKNLNRNRYRTIDDDKEDEPKDWYDLNCRTNEFIVPSSWIKRLDDANAVNNHFEYLREKLENDEKKQTKKINLEKHFYGTALHRLRQNTFEARLEQHKNRWDSLTLIGESAASLPKPTTDPKEIERQLYKSLRKRN